PLQASRAPPHARFGTLAMAGPCHERDASNEYQYRSRVLSTECLRNTCDEPGCYLLLALRRPGFYPRSLDKRDPVAIATHDTGLRWDSACENPVATFLGELRLGIRRNILGFSGKSDHQVGPLRFSLGDRCKDVRILDQWQLRRGFAGLFLELLLGGIGHTPVCDRGSEDRDVGRQRTLDRIKHFTGAFNFDYLESVWISHLHRSAYQRDVGAGGSSCGGDCMTLLARRAVSDIAHRVNRLLRRGRCPQHPSSPDPARGVCRQQLFNGRRDLPRPPHPAPPL